MNPRGELFARRDPPGAADCRSEFRIWPRKARPHVDGIDLVIHADPLAEYKAYVHRSGRTARNGADGAVVTVQTAAQAAEVRILMRKAGVTPRVATARPGSPVLRSIAGPPRSGPSPR